MGAIFRKEIALFFSSLIGYISIGVFLIITGLFLWVLPDYSILDFGYATLDQLFTISPYIFLFLVPAITMRTFAEERREGTLEILSTKPVSDFQIVFAKYLAGLVLLLISLLPSLIYFYTVSDLAVPAGNVDTGATWGSYFGLIGIASAYLTIGIFASSLTDNQIVSFILAMFLCFFFYELIDMLRTFDAMRPFDAILDSFSIKSHYNSISRGVVDSRDLLYFITFEAAFLFLTSKVNESRKW